MSYRTEPSDSSVMRNSTVSLETAATMTPVGSQCCQVSNYNVFVHTRQNNCFNFKDDACKVCLTLNMITWSQTLVRKIFWLNLLQ